MVPVRKQKHEINEMGNVNLIVPKFKNEKISNFFIPKTKSKYFKVKLDEIGSATWLLIDGEKNVQDICNLLVEKFGEKITPVDERTSKFFTILYNQRFISFKKLLE